MSTKAAKETSTLANAADLTKWAYTGMDPDNRVPTHDFDDNTCLPAAVLWIAMTTNAAYYNDPLDAPTMQRLSDELGITVPCIEHIHSMMRTPIPASMSGGVNLPAVSKDDVQSAFLVVLRAFHNMGSGIGVRKMKNGEPYLPDNCPTIDDLQDLMDAARNHPV